MNLACVNAFIVYIKLPSLLHYKTIVSGHLIGRYTSQSRTLPEQKTGSKRKHQ